MFSFRRRSPRFSHCIAARVLRLESLENRQMMSATTGSLGDVALVDVGSVHATIASLEAGATLDPVSNKTAAAGAPVMFTLNATGPTGESLTYVIYAVDTDVPPSEADVTIDQLTGQVTLTPHAGVIGEVQLRAGVRLTSAVDTAANYDFETFTLSVQKPSLNAVANQNTQGTAPVSFTLTSNDPLGGGVVYDVVDPITLSPPQSVTVSVTQATGQVTLTAEDGFIGTINLLARVRSVDSPAVADSYSIRAFTLQVTSSVSLAQPNDIEVPGAKSVLVPLTGVDPSGAPITYTFSSDNANVELALMSQNSASLVLNVTGTDKNGQAFNGKLTMKLFEDMAPVTTARIKELAASGFYNGKTFHRVIDGFMAQGGGNSLQTIEDEFNALLTFTSPGLLAMANAGHDTGDAQFFITALTDSGETTPIQVGDMPEHLNFKHTIFGQLVDGFDVFQKLMTTNVTTQSTSGEVSKPVSTITIVSAQVEVDTQNAVLRLTPKPGFTGSAEIEVTAHATSGGADVKTFTATGIADSVAEPPFLGVVTDKTTSQGTPVQFQLTSTNLAGGGVVYNVVDPTTLGAPANVTVSIGDNGNVTLTPAAGFSGTINLLARVRASSAADVAANYDTEQFTLTVTANTTKPTLGAVANQTTTIGTAITAPLTSTNQGTSGVIYSVVDPVTGGVPANVTIVANGSNVTLTPASGFTGTINLRARVRNANAPDEASSYDTKDFTLTVNATSTTKPTIGSVANKTTTAGAAVTFTLTATNPTSGALDYQIVDPTSLGAPANVQITINDSTGAVTITPNSGFTGSVNLLARVRLAADPDAPASYSSMSFTLTVTATGVPAVPTSLAVASSAGGGTFDGNGFTSVMPTLTLTAPTGTTVEIKRGSTVIATAIETSTGSGQYRATLPAGTLALGANSLTAVARNTSGASADSTALSITYAPSFDGGVYAVPGVPGASQSLTFAWTSKNAAYNNEFGYVIVSSTSGAINGVAPGAANYAQTLLASANRRVIFSKGQGAGAATTITLTAGQSVVFYMIQNNTTANFLAKNPANAPQGNNNSKAPLAFFSVQAANPDGRKHVQIIADSTSGFAQYNWEDLFSLGDGDFNDAAITVRTSSQTFASPGAIRAPGGSGNVKLNASLSGGMPVGDLGVYFVDNLNGAIGSLKPGDAGYAAAALAAANRTVLYSAGVGGVQQISVPAGKYAAFYGITSGTTANFLTSNSTNATSGSVMAFFSFDGANPDGASHFGWVSPGTQAANPDVMQLHVNDDRGGGSFDSYMLDLRFTA